MQQWAEELERRRSARHRHETDCEVLLAGRTHAATVVDLSQEGVYVESDALVMRERHIPHRLRGIVPRGFGLRWIRGGAPG